MYNCEDAMLARPVVVHVVENAFPLKAIVREHGVAHVQFQRDPVSNPLTSHWACNAVCQSPVRPGVGGVPLQVLKKTGSTLVEAARQPKSEEFQGVEQLQALGSAVEVRPHISQPCRRQEAERHSSTSVQNIPS